MGIGRWDAFQRDARSVDHPRGTRQDESPASRSMEIAQARLQPQMIRCFERRCHSERSPMRGCRVRADACRAPEESNRSRASPSSAPTPQPRRSRAAQRAPTAIRATAGDVAHPLAMPPPTFLQRKRTLRGAGSWRGGLGSGKGACRRGGADSSGAARAVAWLPVAARAAPLGMTSTCASCANPRIRARSSASAAREGGLCAFVAGGFNRPARQPPPTSGATRGRSRACRHGAARLPPGSRRCSPRRRTSRRGCREFIRPARDSACYPPTLNCTEPRRPLRST